MINLLRLIHRLPRTLSDLSGRLAALELRTTALERPTVAPAPQPTPEPEKVGGDCWTCRNAFGASGCSARPLPWEWVNNHLQSDYMTRLPDSPPCPAWRAR